MALAINSQSNTFGIANIAEGNIVTDTVAAVAQTFTIGFAPRKIIFNNLTDRVSDEWYEGMTENAIYNSIVGINAKLDADAGVTDTNYTALWTPGASTVASITAAMTGALAKLDADAGVNSTDYAATYTPTNTISLHSVAAGTVTYEKTNGIAVVDNTFSVTATTLAASKQFYWEAIG